MKKEKLLQNTRLVVMNQEFNKELLKEVPHIKFLDLAFVCLCIDSDTQDAHFVTWKQLEEYGIQFYELFQKTTVNASDYVVRSMYETMMEIAMKEGAGLVMESMPEIQDMKDRPMYVLTNKDKLFGASVLWLKQPFVELSEQLDSDLYILPSSVHEILVIPADSENRDTYENMVTEINANPWVMNEQDILSNSLYRWDRKREMLMIA